MQALRKIRSACYFRVTRDGKSKNKSIDIAGFVTRASRASRNQIYAIFAFLRRIQIRVTRVTRVHSH